MAALFIHVMHLFHVQFKDIKLQCIVKLFVPVYQFSIRNECVLLEFEEINHLKVVQNSNPNIYYLQKPEKCHIMYSSHFPLISLNKSKFNALQTFPKE